MLSRSSLMANVLLLGFPEYIRQIRWKLFFEASIKKSYVHLEAISALYEVNRYKWRFTNSFVTVYEQAY